MLFFSLSRNFKGYFNTKNNDTCPESLKVMSERGQLESSGSEVKAKPATMKYGRRAGDTKRAQGQNSVSSSNRHNKKPVTVMGTGTAYFEQA